MLQSDFHMEAFPTIPFLCISLNYCYTKLQNFDAFWLGVRSGKFKQRRGTLLLVRNAAPLELLEVLEKCIQKNCALSCNSFRNPLNPPAKRAG